MVSYLALGNKEAARTVVFIHGFSGNLLSWQYNLTAIAGARVIALDLPGHGGSDLPGAIDSVTSIAEWIKTALDALEVKRGHIVAHSLGGWASLELARHYPERVQGLSLLGSAGLTRKLDVPLLRKLLAEDDAQSLTHAVTWLTGGSSIAMPNFESTLVRQLNVPNARRGLQEVLERVIAPAFDERLPPLDWSDLRAPMQWIWGANDKVLLPPDMTRCAPSTLTLIKDAGHLLHLQQPAIVNGLLNEFITGLT
jgi:pyruvate dehydrogenase E2 component (dihydrolipoamide acetyltransferase)